MKRSGSGGAPKHATNEAGCSGRAIAPLGHCVIHPPGRTQSAGVHWSVGPLPVRQLASCCSDKRRPTNEKGHQFAIGELDEEARELAGRQANLLISPLILPPANLNINGAG